MSVNHLVPGQVNGVMRENISAGGSEEIVAHCRMSVCIIVQKHNSVPQLSLTFVLNNTTAILKGITMCCYINHFPEEDIPVTTVNFLYISHFWFISFFPITSFNLKSFSTVKKRKYNKKIFEKILNLEIWGKN